MIEHIPELVEAGIDSSPEDRRPWREDGIVASQLWPELIGKPLMTIFTDPKLYEKNNMTGIRSKFQKVYLQTVYHRFYFRKTR